MSFGFEYLKSVLPMPFLNKVSPENKTALPKCGFWERRQMEPGVWPGVSITFRVSAPNFIWSFSDPVTPTICASSSGS